MTERGGARGEAVFKNQGCCAVLADVGGATRTDDSSLLSNSEQPTHLLET